jgi:hypothetical protein
LATSLILKTGQTHSARRLGQLALAQDENDEKARLLLYWLNQNSDGGKSSPNPWQTITNLIDHILRSFNAPSSQVTLQQIAALFDIPIGELIRQHGLRLISQKAYQPASEAFALLVSLTPSDPEAYKSFGVALHGWGHEDEALVAWQVARQLTKVA